MRRALLVSFLFAGLAGCAPTSDVPEHLSQALALGTGPVNIVADGQTEAYALINSSLVTPGSSASAVETPDCLHPDFGPHITQVFDPDLGKPVFVFNMHRDIDGDGAANSGCDRVDRQRLEIKTFGPSPDNTKAFVGDTVSYRWRFKLDAGFQASTSFTHIHQIKAGDGTNTDNPIFTLTPVVLSGGGERLELRYINSTGTPTTRLERVLLAPFKGEWLEVREKISYATPGTYFIEIRRVRDGAILLTDSQSAIETWRTGGTTFVRPKWGIYRSLDQIAALRDEQVLFDGFCLAKGSDDCPSLLGTPPLTAILEAESLTRTTSGPNASLQLDATASGGQWVVYTAPGAGSWVEYALPNIRRGVYELKLTYKTATTRGIHNIAVDGVVVGPTIDQYKIGSAEFPDVTIGTFRFDTDGNHVVRLTSQGKNPLSTGFGISADRFLLVSDPNPPVLSVPADMTVEASGPAGATVTFSGTASDKQEGALPVTFSPPSGSTFALGATTVTATATDLNGNVGTATFVVNVVDTTPPTLTVPGNLIAEAIGPAGAVVTFAATAQDQVSGALPVMFSTAPGSTFPLGATTVTATATDLSGNVGTATFVVNVVDTTPPPLTLPGNLIAEATGPSGAVVTFAATAQDQVGGSLPVMFSPASGSTFPLGVRIVTATAADAAGNSTTGTFSVTVTDTRAPVIRSLTATPDNIWPPNNRMVPVKISADVIDQVDGHPQTRVIAVSDNQPGCGHGPSDPDFVIDGPLSVQVRAERTASEGARIYTITVESRDASGNKSTGHVEVKVPKSGGH